MKSKQKAEDESKKIDEKKITRVEVINHAKNDKSIGRLLTLHKSLGDFNTIELQLQDGGKTLKIFLG
jgi:diphthamide synthase subunit DPH2